MGRGAVVTLLSIQSTGPQDWQDEGPLAGMSDCFGPFPKHIRGSKEKTKREREREAKRKTNVSKKAKAHFLKYTVTEKVKGKVVPVADQPCWFDLSLGNVCAKCKTGGAQCGSPMGKWCQSKKNLAKGLGCNGIPNYKYTLSTTGYPCYWNPKSLDCAWCAPNRIQCKDSQQAQKCGSYCDKATSMKCDGVLTTCKNIDKCGFGASCDKKSSSCKCEKGLNGNGFQCFNATSGEPVSNPNGNVEISIDTASKFFVYPDGSELFPPTV